MEILAEKPPLYDEIEKRFPTANVKDAIFAWGDRIYNLDGRPLSQALLAHEAVHCQRQVEHGMLEGGQKLPLERAVALWWRRYLYDDAFRLEEEVIAHAVEYRVAAIGKNRHHRRALLKAIAARLSGPLYGNLISPEGAKVRILSLAESV